MNPLRHFIRIEKDRHGRDAVVAAAPAPVISPVQMTPGPTSIPQTGSAYSPPQSQFLPSGERKETLTQSIGRNIGYGVSKAAQPLGKAFGWSFVSPTLLSVPVYAGTALRNVAGPDKLNQIFNKPQTITKTQTVQPKAGITYAPAQRSYSFTPTTPLTPLQPLKTTMRGPP